MLLHVGNFSRMNQRVCSRNGFRIGSLFFLFILGGAALSFSSQAPAQTAPGAPAGQSATPQTPAAAGAPQAAPQASSQTPQQVTPRAGLNVVVLDPAHGGTDPGARGTGGM